LGTPLLESDSISMANYQHKQTQTNTIRAEPEAYTVRRNISAHQLDTVTSQESAKLPMGRAGPGRNHQTQILTTVPSV